MNLFVLFADNSLSLSHRSLYFTHPFVLFADNSLPLAGLFPSAFSSSYSKITPYHSVTDIFPSTNCSSYPDNSLSLSHRCLYTSAMHLFVLFADNSLLISHRYLFFSQLFVLFADNLILITQSQISFLRPTLHLIQITPYLSVTGLFTSAISSSYSQINSLSLSHRSLYTYLFFLSKSLSYSQLSYHSYIFSL